MTGYTYFKEYIHDMGIDISLDVIPFYLHGQHLEIPFKVSVFLGFLIHCVHDRRVSAATACTNYGPAALFMLEKVHNVDVSIIKSSPTVKAAKGGLTLEYALRNPDFKRGRLPYTVESLLFGKQQVFNDPANLVHEMIVLQQEFQLSTLARISEVLIHPGAHTHHHLRNDETVFAVQDGNNIVQYVGAANVHIVDPTCNFRVIDVIITRSSAKNDISGLGNNFSFSGDGSDSQAFNLATDMYKWAHKGCRRDNDPFFSYQGNWALSYTQANEAIKECMRRQGFEKNLSQFSTHSLRIGGASLLAASGFSDCVIQKMGGWKSNAFLKYIRLAVAAFKKCQDALSNPSILTNDHLIRMLPGFNAASTTSISLAAQTSVTALPPQRVPAVKKQRVSSTSTPVVTAIVPTTHPAVPHRKSTRSSTTLNIQSTILNLRETLRL